MLGWFYFVLFCLEGEEGRGDCYLCGGRGRGGRDLVLLTDFAIVEGGGEIMEEVVV